MNRKLLQKWLFKPLKPMQEIILIQLKLLVSLELYF